MAKTTQSTLKIETMKARLIKTLLIVALIVIGLYITACYFFSTLILTPNSSFEKTQHDIDKYWGKTYDEWIGLLPPPEGFFAEGIDNATIKGQYFNVSDSATCVFIFAHGWGRSWRDMLKYYPLVEDCGCNIVMYDHRVHGESSGEFPTGGIKESQDLLAVTRWVQQEKRYAMNQIAWLGSSWGAGASLIAGATDEDPAFILADSPYQNWQSAIFERASEDYGGWVNSLAPGVMAMVGFRADVDASKASPLDAAKNIKEPVLLIHSATDPKTSSQQSVNISRNLNASSEFHHTQWGNIHVLDVINNLEEMKKLLKDFIEQKTIHEFNAMN